MTSAVDGRGCICVHLHLLACTRLAKVEYRSEGDVSNEYTIIALKQLSQSQGSMTTAAQQKKYNR